MKVSRRMGSSYPDRAAAGDPFAGQPVGVGVVSEEESQ